MFAIYGDIQAPPCIAVFRRPSARGNPSARDERPSAIGLWERRHNIPQHATSRRGAEWASWGHAKASWRLPGVESPFVLRAELLTVVPHSMSTIDRLEAKGQFPGRIRLEPTNRVAWVRREVTAYLRHLAKRRPPAAQEDHSEAANQELVGPLKAKRAEPAGSAR